jgi:hypothetical protein
MRSTFRKLRTLRSGLDHLQRLAQIVRGPCWMYLASLTKRIVLGCASQGSSTSLAPSPFFGRPEGDGCAGGRHRGHKEKYADNQSFCHGSHRDRRSSRTLAASERLCAQRPAIYGPAFRSDWRPMSEMYQFALAQDAGEKDALELRDRGDLPPALREKDRSLHGR